MNKNQKSHRYCEKYNKLEKTKYITIHWQILLEIHILKMEPVVTNVAILLKPVCVHVLIAAS